MNTKTIAWQTPSTWNGIHHNYRTAPATISDAPDIFDGPIKLVWWASLLPGGFIAPHVDAPPWHVRWHIPVQPAGWTWMEGTEPFCPTEPFLMTHYEPHAVWNPTDTDRIHLIIDMEQPIKGLRESLDSGDMGGVKRGLEICEMIEPIQQMIEAI